MSQNWASILTLRQTSNQSTISDDGVSLILLLWDILVSEKTLLLGNQGKYIKVVLGCKITNKLLCCAPVYSFLGYICCHEL